MVQIKDYVALKKDELKKRILLLPKKPTLKIIQVNDDYASNSYIKGKIKDLNEIGANPILEKLSPFTSQEELLRIIDENVVKCTIDPKKDLDGFNPLTKFKSATPKGILTYLKDQGYDFKGKNCLIIGRSNIVGKPMAKYLLDEDMTVTVAHSKTPLDNLKLFVQNADLIIVAVGKPEFLNKTFTFKKTAFVIDVGINRDKDNHLVGDCEKDLPPSLLPRLPRSSHSRVWLSFCVPAVLMVRGTGISTCSPSATSLDLALGPDLPRADQLYSGNLGYSATRILTLFSLLIPAFSLLNPPRPLPVPLRRVNNAPLPLIPTYKSWVSAVCFSPGHFRRRTSRLVSYYALFECVAASKPTS